MTPDRQRTFKPRLAPRNIADTAIVAAISLLHFGMLVLLPLWLVYALSDDPGLAGATTLALDMFIILHTVQEAEVGDEGIMLERILGNPRLLPWSEITAVTEASRCELILHGWLWPVLMPREMSASCTTEGHYRIQFGKRHVYFPPADPEAFMAAIAHHRPVA